MFHGLSRTTLNILIIGCLLFIAGIHLLTRDNTADELPPLELSPLPSDSWQTWYSSFGVAVRWQTRASDELQVRIQGAEGETREFSLPAQDWSRALVAEVSEPEQSIVASLVLAGPLDSEELRNAAAFIVRQQKLMASEASLNLCQVEHPAGASWWNRQQQRDWTAEAVVSGDLPENREAWADFRQQSVRALRQDLFSNERTIDIYARLTYHQWPDDYLTALYKDLGQAQMTAPQAYADCRQQALTEQQSDPQFEQQSTASVTHHRRGVALPTSQVSGG